MKKIKWTDLILFIVTAELVGVLSSLISGGYSAFYTDLEKPPLSPPGVVFPVVWAILYALMGISAYLVYHSEESMKRKEALVIYTIQLLVNFSWSIIFFRFEALGLAAAVAAILFILVASMVTAFRRVRPLAAALNIPYLLWSLFAAYLAAGNWVLNR